MYSELITEYWFPTPIYIENISDTKNLNNYLESHIVNWAKNDEGIKNSNINGWHSKTNMHLLSEYKPLVDIINHTSNKLFKKENIKGNPIIGNMWANINPKESYNLVHSHANSIYSGVYYIKTPENCGDLILEDPRPFSHFQKIPRIDNNEKAQNFKSVNYKPIEGRIIIFPSALMHYVGTNLSDDIRISVSFNILIDTLQNIVKPEDIERN